ncbi:hypothetical protein SAMN05428985_103364 [Nocardioides sp. YR527]|uniref:hypothetical protein n=1 Tax=Nocardioides sp. YR527 TaxID=1881028 RepID=UPI0008873F54|nr:hypothetical protein [Nocardioides sp. YR527]SDK27740.1 hypothetical protein SAMN05428985_103364 [Nocardioides sp. YR527]
MSSTGNDILRRRSQAVAEAVASRFAPTTYAQVDRVGRTEVRLTMPHHLVEFELDWMDDLVEVFVQPLGSGRHARRRLVGMLPAYDRALFESETRRAVGRGGLRGMAAQIDAAARAFELFCDDAPACREAGF